MHLLTTRTAAILLLLLTLAAAGCAGYGGQGSAAPATFADGILVDPGGMTLYTFDKDPRGAGTSVCTGRCARNWPPLLAGSAAEASGNFSIVRRDDGSRQWAYDGKPLYLWVKDRKPGDRTGDNFKNVWHVIERGGAMTAPEHTGY